MTALVILQTVIVVLLAALLWLVRTLIREGWWE